MIREGLKFRCILNAFQAGHPRSAGRALLHLDTCIWIGS
jgi:hypothetical protein